MIGLALSTMKKYSIIFKHSFNLFLFGLVLVSKASQALALDTGLGYGTLTGLGTLDLRVSIMSIIRLLFGFLGVLVLVAIIFGGFLVMTAGGDESKNSNGRKVIASGVVGLAVLFLSYAIASFVISQLISATGAS